MKKKSPKYVTLLSVSCLLFLLSVGGFIFFSERLADAGNGSESFQEKNNSPIVPDTATYATAFERIRSEYANVKTIEMEANVVIEIFKNGTVISGTGRLKFDARDNKYKYSCEVSDNLQNEGLMRNVDILYTGDKFYFFDKESKIVSFQSSEEVRFPSALPNPFFLPIEFLGNDDDSCDGCKMRLQDVKMPIRWAKRASLISELSSESNNGIMYSLIEMPGGDLNRIPYNYRVRLVGQSPETMQPVSVSRVKEGGLPLAEILLSDLRTVQGINVKIPYVVEIGSRDDTGSLSLKAVFTINSLKINQPFENNLLSPAFPDAESYWDSDTKNFVEK